ncbi:MAG: 30S ribosomal protein S6 [Candidatus Melainabacteria bacterium GWF2_32_7]|nr:MAG: 30S ribosomal protein S6 [Candidatus Melainabacteria bacterium GWF2_32_7]
MRKYELLCIIKTNLDMEGIEQVTQNISDNIVNMGGQILNVDKIGRKKLGYEIEKLRDGFFVVFNIELPENKVADLKRYLKLNEDVIRELTTVQEKVKVAS